MVMQVDLEELSFNFLRQPTLFLKTINLMMVGSILPHNEIDRMKRNVILIGLPKQCKYLPIHFLQTLSLGQLNAYHLYKSGINILPIMTPKLLKLLGTIAPDQYRSDDKHPYLYKEFNYQRLYLCDGNCSINTFSLNQICPFEKYHCHFFDLFYETNIGVMVGKISGNLVCIDNDNDASSEQVVDFFRTNSIPGWFYKTSRGINVLVRLAEGEAINQPKSMIDGMQIWGHDHFVVVPPSFHASGEIYTWIDIYGNYLDNPLSIELPTIEHKQIADLGVTLRRNKPLLNIPHLPFEAKYLSRNNQELLCVTIQKGERNTQLTKIIYDIAANIKAGNIEQTKAEQLIKYATQNCIPPYEFAHALKMLYTALKKKGLSCASKCSSINKYSIEFEQDIKNAQTFFRRYNWRSHGRTASTDQAIFSALIDRCRMDQTRVFRATCRELCVLANIQQHHTVMKALHRLCQKGLIRFVDSQKNRARRYAFSDYILTTNYPSNIPLLNTGVITQQVKDENNLISDEINDVFYRKFLPRLIWRTLLQSPRSSLHDISRLTGKHIRSVKYALTWLIKWELVSISSAENIYIAEVYDQLHFREISLKLGTIGKSANRRLRFSTEREILLNKMVARRKWQIQSLINNYRGEKCIQK
jgi:hypothetical protein